MKTFHIEPVSGKLRPELKHKIDFKTKPLGALGQLEDIALQAGLVQNTLSPVLKNPHIIVFAADHGIAGEGVSPYPQEVTFQMVMNFLNGGAAINVFCKQNNIKIKVIDAGVNYQFPEMPGLINKKAGMGTKNFLHEAAMSVNEAQQCIGNGAEVVNEIYKNGCNIVGFGEMGIGNTSSACALMSVICKIPVELCAGRGAGLDDAGLQHKIEVMKKAIANHKPPDTPLKVLAIFGGFEIAQLCGAMLQAAENKMLILVDGFISTAAFLVAYKIHPAVLDYAVFCHQSDERGHTAMLKFLNVKPLLNLSMRLGEGTGAAIGYPVIQAAVNFLNEMASFESAGVSNKEEKVTA